MAMPRMPSSSVMRPERLSGRGLDAIGNGGLHAIEEEEAAEDDESDDGAGSEKQEAGGLAAASDGPAEAVNDDVGGHLKGVGEVGPGDESGEIENGIGEAVGGELGEAAEE